MSDELPKHSAWVPAKVDDREFRVAKIEVDLSVHLVENPSPIELDDLESVSNWFVHHWDHTKSAQDLRSLLDPNDRFQVEDPFELLSNKQLVAFERSYRHMVEYNGFLFLIGLKRDKNAKSVQAIAVYFWDAKAKRFRAVLDTPAFREVSGKEFWSALYKVDLDTFFPKEGAYRKPVSNKIR